MQTGYSAAFFSVISSSRPESPPAGLRARTFNSLLILCQHSILDVNPVLPVILAYEFEHVVPFLVLNFLCDANKTKLGAAIRYWEIEQSSRGHYGTKLVV